MNQDLHDLQGSKRSFPVFQVKIRNPGAASISRFVEGLVAISLDRKRSSMQMCRLRQLKSAVCAYIIYTLTFSPKYSTQQLLPVGSKITICSLFVFFLFCAAQRQNISLHSVRLRDVRLHHLLCKLHGIVLFDGGLCGHCKDQKDNFIDSVRMALPL